MKNDEIIRRMYSFYLNDDVPNYCIYALMFEPPTFSPAKEQAEYIVKYVDVPSNLRDVLKNDKKNLIFAVMKHFQVSRTKSWEMCELFLSDYLSEKPQFMPKKLQESMKLLREDNIKLWLPFHKHFNEDQTLAYLNEQFPIKAEVES